MATIGTQDPNDTGPSGQPAATPAAPGADEARRLERLRASHGSHRTSGFDQTAAQQKQDDFRASGSPAPLPGDGKA